MLDLNTLIKQRNLIRKYQGDGGTGVTTDIPVSRVGPMGAYSAPGPGITNTGDIWSILPEVPVEGEKETNEEITARYQEMFNQGVTPEIPYGKRVHGYDSPYIDPSETLASVFKVKRDNKGLPLERYDERDMPMLEYLYHVLAYFIVFHDMLSSLTYIRAFSKYFTVFQHISMQHSIIF